MKVAVIQLEIAPGEPKTNLARAEEFIRDAARKGAELAVLPENFVTGGISRRPHLADTEGRYRETMCSLARQYHVDLIPGSEGEKEGNEYFNTMYYIAADGQVKARYRKKNLWLSEKPLFTRGRDPGVCDTRFGRVGLSICWDLAFPELYTGHFMAGARIMVNAAHWSFEDAGPGLRHNPNAEPVFIDACCTARAFENEAVFIFCNSAGTWKDPAITLRSAGHSQVCLPFKGPIAKLDHAREEMLLCEADLAVLPDAEKAYEIGLDRLGGSNVR